MNEMLQSLATVLTPLFDSGGRENCYAADSRTLFYALIHVGEQSACLEAAYIFIQEQLQSVGQTPSTEYDGPDIFQALFNATSIALPKQLTLDCLRLLSPVVLTELAWLDNSVQACTNQIPIAIDLQALYLRLKPDVQRHDPQELGIYTWAFAQQAEIPVALFDFAALQLAFGQFSRVFLAEILGFTLAYCQTGGLSGLIDPPLSGTKPSLLKAQLPELQRMVQAYLADFPTQQAVLWQRIQAGYRLFVQQLEQSSQQLQSLLGQAASTQQDFIALLNRVRTLTLGHHRHIMVGDKSLDVWFAQTPFDSTVFLQALRESDYIDQQHPANSRLLKAFEFTGPMFGVLNADELALLTRWVCRDNSEPIRESPRNSALSVSHNRQADAPHRFATHFNLTNRNWYYTLVNIDLFPAALKAAKLKVQGILKRTQLVSRLPFKYYSHQVFDDFIQSLYQHELNTYQPLTGAPKISKQAYIFAIEQLAPAILVDGCWLQNIQQLNYHTTHAVAALLSKIYTDELGGGILQQNHPFIYQQLLDSVGLQLPPIYCREFSQHPGFIVSAFDIPNYLLAISKFPSAFLPELLGLNMAIELSGLGKDYLRLTQALKFYGLDPTIVNVHISIDNVSSGHAALAKRAIQLYLDEILACSGRDAMEQHWRRIYTGYCSLAWISWRFKLALVSNVLWNRLSHNAMTHFKGRHP